MTSVYASSFMALTTSTATRNTAASDDALFSLDTGSDTQTTTSTQSISGFFNSGLSADTLSALFNSSNGVDPLDALFAAVNGDTSSSSSSSDNANGISPSVAALLGLDGTSSSSALDPLNLSADDDAFIHGDGPLPAFLSQVKTQLGLNSTQATALDNIALQFKDANNTPDTVQKVADALRQAGITSA